MIQTRLLIVFIALAYLGCDKSTGPSSTPTPNPLFAFATVSAKDGSGNGIFRWTYTGQDSLTRIKWENTSTTPATLVADIPDITYTGGHLSKIEVNLKDNQQVSFKYTYSATYNAAGGLVKITWLDSRYPTRLWNYDLEYEGGRAVQFNKYRTTNGVPDAGTSRIFAFTYNSDGNITQAVESGSNSRTHTFKYDDKLNKGFGNEALAFIWMGEVSSTLNHFWGQTFMLTLTKNNVTEDVITTTTTTEKHAYDYTYAADGSITAVADTWTLVNGTQSTSNWILTAP